MGFLLPNPPGVSVQAIETRAVRQITETYFIRIVPFGSSSFSSDGALSYTTTANAANYDPIRSALNPVTTIPRVGARNTTTVAGGAGWNMGISSPGFNAIYMPFTNNVNGWRHEMICGFDTPFTALPTDVEFVFGVNSNGGAMPASGMQVINSAANWCGIYSTLGSDSINFGFKNAGTTTVNHIATLPIPFSEYQGMRIQLECNPADSSIDYIVEHLTGFGVFTVLVSGNLTGWGTPGMSIASCCMAFKNSVAGQSTIWQAMALLQAFRP